MIKALRLVKGLNINPNFSLPARRCSHILLAGGEKFV